MPDTVILAEESLEALHDSLSQGVTAIVKQTHELQREISREVEFRLSPLEKFLKKAVIVRAPTMVCRGVLVDFGPGWVEVDAEGRRTVVFTGAGVAVLPEKEKRDG